MSDQMYNENVLTTRDDLLEKIDVLIRTGFEYHDITDLLSSEYPFISDFNILGLVLHVRRELIFEDVYPFLEHNEWVDHSHEVSFDPLTYQAYGSLLFIESNFERIMLSGLLLNVESKETISRILKYNGTSDFSDFIKKSIEEMMIESFKEDKIITILLDDTCGINNYEELIKFEEYLYEKYDAQLKIILRGVLGEYSKYLSNDRFIAHLFLSSLSRFKGLTFEDSLELHEAISNCVNYNSPQKLYEFIKKSNNKVALKHENNISLAYYDELITNDPSDSNYNLRGCYYLNNEQYSLALDDFTKAIRLDDTDSFCYYNRAEAYLLNGNKEPGLKDLQSCWDNFSNLVEEEYNSIILVEAIISLLFTARNLFPEKEYHQIQNKWITRKKTLLSEFNRLRENIL